MCKAMVEKSFCVVCTLEHFAVSAACAGHSVLSIEQLPAVSCVIRCGARALFIIILLRSVGDGTASHRKFFPAPSGRGLLHSVARTRTQDRPPLTEHTHACVLAPAGLHLQAASLSQSLLRRLRPICICLLSGRPALACVYWHLLLCLAAARSHLPVCFRSLHLI